MFYQETYEKWLASPALTAEEKDELRSIAGDDGERESRFFGPLEFGTAGLRGTMGVGLNRMNVHVIRHATQAFAEVILAEGGEAAKRGVALCYDCRHHSDEFAREAACVMAGNGIQVRIFESLRPTPELSFAIRTYGCIAGINVTASHNPKEYNGYKVYWEDGAQLPPNHAAAIAKKMEEIDIFTSIRRMDYDEAVKAGMVTVMGSETDEQFLAQVMGQVNDRAAVEKVADTFKMVYTPFHGTGYKLIPEALKRLGMKHVLCVPQQMILDGDFPTVVSPNPENPEGFTLAIALAKAHGADFILGSDPDADRVGIMVKDSAGEYVTISGNQTGVLLLDYLIGAKKRAGTLPSNAVALKTIVTTEMARKVAEVNGITCYDTFTGFKFMAEKKNKLEAEGTGKVIFSYEESYGYMIGDYVRDKDAVTAALVLTEMAAWYAGQGMTLYDALQALFAKYGFYGERTLNLVMPGLDGLAKMKALMDDLRAKPLTEIAGVAVTGRKDYADGTDTDAATGRVTAMELCGSNVLKYKLADGTDLIVRPSGTEPKVKVYILAQGEDKAQCDAKTAQYSAWAETLRR
ncbi:MAG: phospho-sugar mutase [Pseudoflavonifractor sp.]